jgi:thiol-disulfide isomerase/thioredoxin
MGGRARFVSENYGASELAKTYGVTRYPAIFVDDILFATPNDFGFYGRGEGKNGGRYAPLKSAETHEKIRTDLKRMIELVLAGRKDAARAEGASAAPPVVAQLPAFSITDLDGKTLARKDLEGRVVVVELWATWCPPCRSSLKWLGELKKTHGDKLAVVALAVESDEPNVKKLAKELGLPFSFAMATPELVRGLGDVSSVPTLLVFDKEGKAAAAYYGAPPDLHRAAEAKLASLM